MYISKIHISRRAVLRGVGASIALPFLDAMLPALTPLSRIPAGPKPRFVAIEMVHGAAGSTALGRAKNYWSPAAAGANFEFTPTLKPLEPLRTYLTVISNTELHNAMSLAADEDGPMADHARSSAVFLTAAHPRRTEGDDIRSGPSIDQIYSQHAAADTPIPSLQLSIENSSMAGGCGHGYSCAYTNTISWASPAKPLAMEASPRIVFERLFGFPSARSVPKAERPANRSILDTVPGVVARLKSRLGAMDRNRVNDYLESIREVERRIHNIEETNAAGPDRKLLGAPASVPDSFDEHAKLMFDMQVLAFSADITRVCTFKMGIDRSQRVYPESGVTAPFHSLSHHHEDPEQIEEFAKLNRYHVSKVAEFLQHLRDTPEADGNLLDHSLVLYGSPMGDSHVHEHKFLPLFLAGRANGMFRGNLHVRCQPETPMANVLLTVLHKLGVDIDRVGDSTGEVAL
jgi:hypothetical protein